MIFGVDWGTRRVAIAGPDYLLATLRLPDPKTGMKLLATPRELQLLGGFIAAVVPPEGTIWLERPFMGRPNVNVNTAIRLGMSAGALFARHAGVGRIVDQATWKAAVVGNGSASKHDVATWLNDQDPASAEACAGDQDLIDACCIRIFGTLVAEERVAEPGQVPRRIGRSHVRA